MSRKMKFREFLTWKKTKVSKNEESKTTNENEVSIGEAPKDNEVSEVSVSEVNVSEEVIIDFGVPKVNVEEIENEALANTFK